MIQVQRLSKYFGGLAAVWNLDFELQPREILGLIGPNGAGKTTVFNTITGFLRPDRGSITFKQDMLDGLRPDQIARKGIARTFQHTNLFESNTAMGNIMAGFHRHANTSLWQALFGTKGYRSEEEAFRSQAKEILELMGITKWENTLVQNLPHGQKRALAICVALAVKPEILLLDEPATGLTGEERLILMERIKSIRERGISVILVEHNMQVVMGICDRIVVMNYGSKIAEGTPGEIRDNEAVMEAYLGKE